MVGCQNAAIGEAPASAPQASEAYEALAVERNTLVRHDLADVQRDLEADRISQHETAIRIVEVVTFYGLKPVEIPASVAEITDEFIGVVCWMSVRPPTSRAPTPAEASGDRFG